MYTDNNWLTYVLHTAKLDAMGQYYIAGIDFYTFALSYKSAKANADADALSSTSWEDHDQHIEADIGWDSFQCETGYHLDRGVFLQYTGHWDLRYTGRSKKTCCWKIASQLRVKTLW